MRRLGSILLLCCGLPWFWPAPAWADDVLRLLQLSADLESRLLEEDLSRYLEARQGERRALERLQDLSSQLDRALADQEVPLAELRRLEGQLAGARETAFARAQEIARLRESLYRSMARVTELGEEIARRERSRSDAEARLDGTWQVEIQPSGDFGLFRLETNGTLVSGSYVMESGGRGSLRGTFTGGILDLERIDAFLGIDANMEGVLGPDGDLRGSWSGREVAGGSASGGEWIARKIELLPPAP